MREIGHYNYENVDLREKATWLDGAPGGRDDALPARLRKLASTFTLSEARLTTNIQVLGATWTGRGASAAQNSLRRAALRTTAAQEANDRGHAAVADYGVSFEEVRRRVHFEDPNAGWRPAPSGGAVLPGDPFSVQDDQFAAMQRHRTADAAANAALRAHEQRTRELVERFPTLDGAPTSPAAAGAAGTGGIGTPVAGSGSSGGAGGSWTGGPGAVVPPTGGPPGGAVANVPAAGGGGVPGSPAGSGPGPSSVPQALPPGGPGDAGRPGPGTGSGGAPGGAGGTLGGGFVPGPGGANRPSVRATPPWLGAGPGSMRFGGGPAGGSGVIGGGRSPSMFAPGGISEGRQFSSRLPAVAEPVVPGGPAGGSGRSTSTMYPPMMGMGAGGGGTSTRRTKYWPPSSAAFDVELPPHVDGVIGAEPEDR